MGDLTSIYPASSERATFANLAAFIKDLSSTSVLLLVYFCNVPIFSCKMPLL